LAEIFWRLSILHISKIDHLVDAKEP